MFRELIFLAAALSIASAVLEGPNVCTRQEIGVKEKYGGEEEGQEALNLRITSVAGNSQRQSFVRCTISDR
ncbi:hypothetical protein EVAR_60168_1 [Eumeta japonica]|uniref:Uncharacterized protein n=1 Tax=Eumeta variegata TaxID=151549 RepID=A0A4C1Z695_EUMVA|nr:hypothetical protein EVAR_60168_1 [Eumeta japonica]